MADVPNYPEGSLFIVATPIGNLEDITIRALKILKEADLIAAEDTRRTRKLLNAYGISTPLVSLHEHNERQKSDLIIAKIKSGQKVAYVTDAGTPCISDPGHRLVKLVQAQDIRTVPIPGPSAVITALSASGVPADNFVFYGFLPSGQNKRRQLLEQLVNEEKTMVFFESPTRYQAALQDIYSVLGDREIVIARELTKVFEEIRCGWLSHLMTNYVKIRAKGEFTIILRGRAKEESFMTEAEIEKKLEQLFRNRKTSLRDAVNEIVGQTGLPRKKVYNLAVKIRS